MANVFSHFINPEIIGTPEGDHFLPVYQEEIKDGVKTLVQTGYTNVYEQIQADLESTKIENILHAVAMRDLSALHQRDATYVDATNMPKNLMEAQNLVLRMKTEFEKMPVEVKEKFNNSADKYVELMGTEEFNDIMEPYNKKIADIKAAGDLKAYEKKVADQAKFENDVAAKKGGSKE